MIVLNMLRKKKTRFINAIFPEVRIVLYYCVLAWFDFKSEDGRRGLFCLFISELVIANSWLALIWDRCGIAARIFLYI